MRINIIMNAEPISGPGIQSAYINAVLLDHAPRSGSFPLATTTIHHQKAVLCSVLS
jgi:hypothetical protein